MGVAAAICAPMAAAQSTLPPTQQLQLRRWPIVGGWYVVLVRVRSLGGKPGCLLTTGYDTSETDYRVWGLRVAGNEVTFILNSKWEKDVVSPEMEVSIDGYLVDRFRITERPPMTTNGVSTAVAAVTGLTAQKKVIGLIHAGGVLSIVSGQALYTAELNPIAASNFNECLREAELLRQLQGSPGRLFIALMGTPSKQQYRQRLAV